MSYTKEQIESGNLTAMELVDSWTSGQGNPTTEKYAANKKELESFITSTTINDNVLAARGIIDLIKNGISASMKEALASGYAGGPNHFDQYKEKGKKVDKEEDNVIPGHFMSADTFLRNSYKEFVPYDVLLDAFLSITDKMTKAEIIALKDETLTIPAERMDAVIALREKHEVLDIAKFDLAPYLNDIEVINEKNLRGTINPLLTDQDLDDFDRLLNESFKSYKKDAIAVGKFSTKLVFAVTLKD